MPSAPELSLADRRLLLRAQLRDQRQCIALQLRAGARDGYPRSMTMRLLLYRSALVVALAAALAGRRAAGRVHALTIVVRALTAFTALAPEHSTSSPP